MDQLPNITTKRLTLRAFMADDAEDVRRLAGDFEIADTTAVIPHPYEQGMFEEWFERHAHDMRELRTLNWAVTVTEKGALVGAVSLMNIESKARKTEIGYWIGKDSWGKGYCTEAARAVIAFAFADLNLNRVYAHHMIRNPASGTVMRKIGMSYEGRMRQHMERWGKLEDIDLYGILAGD